MISPLRALPLTLLFACGSLAEPVPPAREQHAAGDTGTLGATSDTGEEASVTLGDGGAGSGDGGCTIDDLRWDAGVRPGDANPGPSGSEELDHDDAVVAYGSVRNPCDEPVVIDQPDSCLVRGFDLLELQSGGGRYQAIDCFESTRQTELDSGDVAESSFDLGQLAPGDYLLTAHFAVDERTASTTFTVR